MEEIKYTKQERKEIYEALDLILDDIGRLWQTATVEKIKVALPCQYNDFRAGLIITNQAIKIGTHYVETDNKLYLETLIGKRKIRKKPPIDIAVSMIRNYDNIRQEIEFQIVEKTKKLNDEKEKTRRAIADIRKQYTKDATIELDLGPSQNIHEIEVVEEDGKKIGTINFGNRLIKIITDGDIVLVKRDKRKQKQK